MYIVSRQGPKNINNKQTKATKYCVRVRRERSSSTDSSERAPRTLVEAEEDGPQPSSTDLAGLAWLGLAAGWVGRSEAPPSSFWFDLDGRRRPQRDAQSFGRRSRSLCSIWRAVDRVLIDPPYTCWDDGPRHFGPLIEFAGRPAACPVVFVSKCVQAESNMRTHSPKLRSIDPMHATGEGSNEPGRGRARRR